MGRPRKQDRDRYESGRLKAVPKAVQEARAMNCVVMQRVRHHGAADIAFVTDGRKVRIGRDDPLWGSVLGRLYAQQMISYDQHEALLEYGRRRSDWLRLKVDQRPNAKSLDFGGTARGLSCVAEPDEEVTLRKLRAHGDMMRELDELERVEAPGHPRTRILSLTELLDRIMILDQEIALSPTNLGAVRSAANALVRHLKGATR